MSKTIAICNQKGGVGKTTTAVNLSAALALSGVETLLIDLDPQANATGGFGIDKRTVTQSIYQVLLEGLPALSVVCKTPIQNLALIPSQVALSGAEIELAGFSEREERLKKAIQSLRDSYEIVLIDAPPSLGLLTINALTAADSVLIPLQCEYYALEGLSQLLETIQLVQEVLNKDLAIEGVLLTMADFRTKLTVDVIEEARRFFGSKVYQTVIPRSVRLSEAPSHGLPIALYDPESVGAKAYRALSEQLWRQTRNDAGTDTRIGQRDPGFDPGEKSGSNPGSAGEPNSPEGGDCLDPDKPDPAQSVPTSAEPR